MSTYHVTISPAGEEIHLLLRGPGIQESGRQYVFANTARCAAFADAVNFAYEQGLRDGLRRRAGDRQDRLLIVSGAHPDELRLRPERCWERLRRRALARFRA
jgi:hypothetical protein